MNQAEADEYEKDGLTRDILEHLFMRVMDLNWENYPRLSPPNDYMLSLIAIREEIEDMDLAEVRAWLESDARRRMLFEPR